jgi:hypothetical protein
MRVVLLASLSFGWGCQETVALGSECPRFGEACLHSGMDPATADDDGDANVAEDAGMRTEDAGLPGDAGAAADGVLGIQNPSFELTRGDGGQVTTLGDNAIEPWYTCRDGLSAVHEADLRAEPEGEPSAADLVAPSDGASFVSVTVPFGVGVSTQLFQRLRSPLGQGRRYAFVVDVQSESGAQDNLALHVWGARASCLPSVHLFASAPLHDGAGWVPVCVSFELERDVQELVLEARSSNLLAAPSRLFVDHLHRSADCK